MYKVRTIALLQFISVCLLWLGIVICAHAEVSIDGVESKVRDNMLACLRLDDDNCDAPDWRVRRLFADSDKEIQKALEVVGYYNIEIEKMLKTGEKCWEASFVITPGKPVLLRKVTIEIDTNGVEEAVLESATHDCVLQPGDVLQHANYDACRRRIARLAESRGYFSARYTERRIDVYPDEHAADITLLLVTGPR
jgi:translocation and assembly module TamA